MKYVRTRGYFWKHQIPMQTVPKLFKIREAETEVIDAEEKKMMTSDEAQQLATVQLMKVLEGKTCN